MKKKKHIPGCSRHMCLESRHCCPSCCCCIAWWNYTCLLPWSNGGGESLVSKIYMKKKKTHTWVLETYASRHPIIVVAAPPAVAASLGGVIRVCCHGPMVVVRPMARMTHVFLRKTYIKLI